MIFFFNDMTFFKLKELQLLVSTKYFSKMTRLKSNLKGENALLVPTFWIDSRFGL